MLTSINPATGETVKKYAETGPEEVTRRLEKARDAFQAWRRTSFSERAALMKAASRTLIESSGEYARTMALEMGKPVKSGRAEIEKCAWVCEYYAEHAERMLHPEIIRTDATHRWEEKKGKS